MTAKFEALETFSIEIHSKIISELDYEIFFLHIPYRDSTRATVETADILDPIFDSNFDARFGDRTDPNNPFDPLETAIVLEKGRLEPSRPLLTTLFNDVCPEPIECYTISIFIPDACNRCWFQCNEEDFFCDHTVCIFDNDG